MVVGQNVKEAAPTKVESFLKRVDKLVSYRVALDEGATNRYSGKMLENWLYAAEAGIPTAFLIDKNGVVQYAEVLENPGDQPDFNAIDTALSALQ